jgi:hypothetical protein
VSTSSGLASFESPIPLQGVIGLHARDAGVTCDRTPGLADDERCAAGNHKYKRVPTWTHTGERGRQTLPVATKRAHAADEHDWHLVPKVLSAEDVEAELGTIGEDTVWHTRPEFIAVRG